MSNLQELKKEELHQINGGFFPVVIVGVYLSSNYLGAIGAGVGAYFASKQ